MAGTYLLGLDSGSTVTKAVIFDTAGRCLGVGHREVPQLHPAPHRVERDMGGLWAAAAAAIRDALADAKVDAADIAGVGVTAHGDGIYLLDREARPLGHGIMSLDSRAFAVAEGWQRDGSAERALELTGQQPSPYAPVSLLAWVKRHEPGRWRRLGHALFCKDWLRYCLTGAIATDLTEASTGFTDVHTQDYSAEALALFGIADAAPALPAIALPVALAGTVTAEAARLTGLKAGTPVATGLHDVTASAVGVGNVEPGTLSITAGTFSINEVLSAEPRIDPRWSCRAGTRRGQWMNMSISPASSSNVEWFLQRIGNGMPSAALLGEMDGELERAFADDSRIVFHPFLYGSPHAGPASASFLGVQGWHGRAHLLRAILEGVVFNHRVHVDALAGGLPVSRCRITGGGSKTPRIAQLFADGLGRTVEIAQTQEAAALGAALCAAVAVGMHPDLEAAARACCRVEAAYQPRPARQAALEQSFRRYLKLVEALQPLWPELDPAATPAREEAAR
jgi:L-xylulokinase